jgi:hypothetical protein
MIDLVIIDRLHSGVIKGQSLPRLISLRPLKKKEISLARKMGVRRFYLPSLTEAESAEFLREFDTWWDQVIRPFDADHPFWRNVVSSKMQEWERSAAYLALMLFTLSKKMTKKMQPIVIVCSSLEEEDLCEVWAKKMGWQVHRKPYLSLPHAIRRVLQEIVNLKTFLYMFAIFLYKKWFSPKHKPKAMLTNQQILIVSLFYKNCFKNGKYQDHFFGTLHNSLRKNDVSVSYLCGPLGRFREATRKVENCSEVSIVIPYSIITWIELILLIIKIGIRRFQFVRTKFCGVDFTKVIKWNTRRFEYFFNLDSEIYYTAVKRLCKNKQFDRLIQMYEGNVFERGCIQAFRSFSSGLIVGYSHAVVFPLNLKIRLSDNEKKHRPEPDVLVATGPESKHLMVTIGNRKPNTIYAACSLRYIPASDAKKMVHHVQSNILVALDGVRASVAILDWLFEHAEIIHDYKVTLRAHPDVPIDILLTQCLYDMPANFFLSDCDLKEDIERSFCVIYRQTSVGMQALMNGVPAIHLNIDLPLSGDPIMNLKASKWSVQTPEELLTALQEIHSLGEGKRDFMDIAKKYARDYFSALDEKSITFFLTERDAVNSHL